MQPLQHVSRGFEALRRRPFIALLAKDPSLPERERGDGASCWRAHRGVRASLELGALRSEACVVQARGG